MKMDDEFEELNLDWEESQPPPRKSGRRSAGLYGLLAVVLAGACVYLAWLHQENRAAIRQLEARVHRARNAHTKIEYASKKVRDNLIQLADYAASETKLHHRLGNRKQALADLDRAQKLLALAEDLDTCGCQGKASQAVKDKLGELIADLQLTKQELSQLASSEGADSRQADSTSAEAKSDQTQPEQPNESGEQHSGGEPDA